MDKLVTCSFTTTGTVERATSRMVLLDAMKQYYKYVCQTLCGIPEVTIAGEVSDWEDIRSRAMLLDEYGLGWWTASLVPILDEFVRAIRGTPNLEFWRSMYKDEHGSGGIHVTGWLSHLFPYLENPHSGKDDIQNPRLLGKNGFLTTASFPRGVSTVPFLWKYFDTDINMVCRAGFFGIHQDPHGGMLCPNIGWAVSETGYPLKARWGDTERQVTTRKHLDEVVAEVRSRKKRVMLLLPVSALPLR